MTFFKRSSARHRAETASHVVRNTTIAAAAGAAIVGSVAPAQASASYTGQAAAAPTAAYTAPATSWSWSWSGGYTWYSYTAPASTYQAPVVESYQAPAVQSASVSSLAPQSTPSTASGKGASIAAAAMGQVGVSQSCTELVTNALRAVGIDHSGWPASYLGLGTQVSAGEAQPGDLVYYVDGGMGFAHIAVYIGDGKAVHGGWNGNQTAVESVNVGSGPVYVRVH